VTAMFPASFWAGVATGVAGVGMFALGFWLGAK